MTARTLPEWIGTTPDAMPPPRVRLRVFDRYDGRCQCGCGRKIMAGEAWQPDHTIALVNGGENRESNLRPLLTEHHKNKTADDVAIKSKVSRIRRAAVGVKQAKSRPMPGSKASGIRRRMSGRVERW